MAQAVNTSSLEEPQIIVRDPGAVQVVRSPLVSGSARDRLLQIGSPIGLLLLWELITKSGLVNTKFFPAPTDIIGSFVNLAASGLLWLDLKASLYRIVAGFLLGAVPGLIIGLAMGLFPLVRAILDPVVAATYPIPKLALLPLFMLIFGIGNEEMILVIASGAVFLVLINTVAGVVELDRIYWDVAKNLGAKWKDYFLTVAFPGALPLIFTGLKLAVGMAVLLIVAAESDGANHGVGFLIWRSYDIYDIRQMYVAFVLLSLIGYIFTVIINEIERWVVKWKA